MILLFKTIVFFFLSINLLFAQPPNATIFEIFRSSDDFYFKIPEQLFGRDIMVVTRLTADEASYFRGDMMSENVIRFERSGDSIYILNMQANRSITPPDDWSIYKFENRQGFVIQCSATIRRKENIINVTNYLQSDNEDIFIYHRPESWGNYISNESSIGNINCYPDHIEMQSVKVYQNEKAKKVTLSLNTSMSLLPKKPMRARYWDGRLTFYKKAVPSACGSGEDNVITRWRLQPKPQDINRYKRGELVEPENPIIFFIDEAVPRQWIPHFIQAVSDWQKPFEKAGFKNAIKAMPAPTVQDNPEFSLFSSKYNVIIYQDIGSGNSSFSTVVDPRSGEIIESHVLIFRGVLDELKKWYFVQASPIDPAGRNPEFSAELLGCLLRYIVSHEVGHTLGFRHNFIASNAVPVENLRNKKWLKENGITPSIMDYARCNYVAQPEDSINFSRGLINSIGKYDEWSIEWGYRLFDADTAIERKLLWEAQTEKMKDQRFCGLESHSDARGEVETLGNDPVLAGEYGIKNLQFVMSHFSEWTKGCNKKTLEELYKEITKQFSYYMNHAGAQVGGLYEIMNTSGQVTYEPVASGMQRRCINFLMKHMFTSPVWLLHADAEVLKECKGLETIKHLHENILYKLLHERTLRNLIFLRAKDEKSFGIRNFLTSLRKGIFPELYERCEKDEYRYGLQSLYINRLLEICDPVSMAAFVVGMPMVTSEERFEIRRHIAAELVQIRNDIEYALPRLEDNNIKSHLQGLAQRIRCLSN